MEKNIVEIFIRYLKERGYPEDSIGVEYKIGKNYRVDVAILDRKQNIPIQLFELKINNSERSKKNGRVQLERSRTILKDKDIPAYLVFPKNESPYFEVLDIDSEKKDDSEGISNENFLIFNYQAQRNKVLYKKAENKKQEKENTINVLKIVSYLLGVFVLVLAILSKVELFKMYPEDLVMLSLLIVLFLIPHASKIKILGIEFERLTESKGER
ncbi:MAG: hypothetical protein LBH25_00865 [Fibromonadaceae bacterium]|jgi:hypothetical protein|nr:hypothetical protein [Fibromonadaceae bacterium]